YGGRSGGRVYRTGDKARYVGGGEIEVLGRWDEQVKVRGYRIELGEIEAALQRHPAVGEAVVITGDDRAGEKRLVAYVVAQTGSTLVMSELRDWLKGKLPEYMIPSSFVELTELPLTPNGKINRGGLPATGETELAGGASFVPPRDALELQLTKMWEEIFGFRPIGVTDNFFELGGQSLLAVRLMARIERALGKRVPVASLFRGATVEQLAALLRQQGERAPQSSLVDIQAGGERRPFFCVHPVGGGVYSYVGLAHQLGLDQPFYGLQSPQLSNEEQPPRTSIETMAAHYLEALRAVQPAGPYLLGGWSMGGLVAFEMARQLEADGEKVALLALMDTTALAFETEGAEDEAAILIGFAHELGLSFEDSSTVRDELLRLEPDERLVYILEEARRDYRLPPDIELARVSHLFSVFKNNVRAMRSYRPRPAQCAVTLFRNSEEAGDSSGDLSMGWNDLAREVTVEVVPGDHYTMMRHPEVKFLAERLSEHLDRVAVNTRH
ncbi:MAG: alpha/beta fold hydrolase, partial [Pyrinomonadaceae bacterium]